MTYLGHASRKLEEPPIPSNLGDDVTMVQKKRLALLATMGLGPGATASNSRPLPPSADSGVKPIGGPPPPPTLDRKAAMLERERKMREREEIERELEEQATKEKLAKKRNAGLEPLGKVQAREEVATPLPSPGSIAFGSISAPSAPPKMKLNIPTGKALPAQPSLAPVCSSCATSCPANAKFCYECGAKLMPIPEDNKSEDEESEDERTEASRPAPGSLKRAPVQQVQPKKKGKKRKKTKKRDHDDEDQDGEWADELQSDEEAEEDQGETQRIQDPIGKARQQAAQSGKIYKNMVVESVKGMVSNNYKGFTDADLERRFQMQQTKSTSSLLSEEQVVRMINQERGEKNSVATQRRIQREQAEWQEKLKKHKEMDMGVHSNSRFERTVVGRK